ncbi:MAG: hypothetical protein NWS20_01840 [Rickettsiaceae bacterium]|nr:hypothetical protein [Rickettsiaceae bacterium]MDP5083567.1 hypothetical protein [Rickettsiaceae bacterium]
MNKLNREKLIYLVKRIINADFDTEEEYDAAEEYFENSVSDPNARDLFHYVPELTPEEIVEKALSYKPIITAPPQKGEDKK